MSLLVQKHDSLQNTISSVCDASNPTVQQRKISGVPVDNSVSLSSGKYPKNKQQDYSMEKLNCSWQIQGTNSDLFLNQFENRCMPESVTMLLNRCANLNTYPMAQFIHQYTGWPSYLHCSNHYSKMHVGNRFGQLFNQYLSPYSEFPSVKYRLNSEGVACCASEQNRFHDKETEEKSPKAENRRKQTSKSKQICKEQKLKKHKTDDKKPTNHDTAIGFNLDSIDCNGIFS